MRFMAIMIPGAYQPGSKIDPNFRPSVDELDEMGKFNEELGKTVQILTLDGLHPLVTKGARLSYAGGKALVTDGPFIEAKEVVGGYWLLEAKSKEQLVEIFKRCPAKPDDVIEIRQVFEMSDLRPRAESAAKS
jgi:hypothetical protein